MQLREKLVGPNDRPGHKLGEEHHEQREAGERRLGRQASAPHVDRVAEGLKRVEADADRQQQPQVRHHDFEADQARRIGEDTEEEVGVLEITEEPKVGAEAQQQPSVATAPSGSVGLRVVAVEVVVAGGDSV